MLTPRANFHHSRLPPPGAIGRIVGLSTVNPLRRCIVESYPLCDNVWPWSLGIHTVTVRFLDNRERRRFSGCYFQADCDSGYCFL
jgi:hypothetical protein